MSGEVCTIVVSDGGGTLADTGFDGSPDKLLGLVILAGGLVILGIIAVVVHKKSRGRGLAVLGMLVIGGSLMIGLTPATPAAAASTDSDACRLIEVTTITRPSGFNLDPGRPVPVLSYQVRNLADFPVEIVVATVLTDDPDALAALVQTRLSVADALSADGALTTIPESRPASLAGGDTVTVAYQATLADPVGPERVGQSATFDSVVTARQVDP